MVTQLPDSAHAIGSSGTSTPLNRPHRAYEIRRATVADAEGIAGLGATLFEDTFGYSMPPEDLATYLHGAYDTAVIAAELASPQHTFLVAVAPTPIAGTRPLVEQGSVVGFAQLTSGTTMACLADYTDNKIELQRLYVHEAYHGTGSLSEEAERIARDELKHELLWLGVWEHNPKAQRFYVKVGFRKVGAKEFTMGSTVQTDEVFVKPLLIQAS